MYLNELMFHFGNISIVGQQSKTLLVIMWHVQLNHICDILSGIP